MITRKIYTEKLILAISSIAFVIVLTSITGIHWGWVDDIFYHNSFSGLYSQLPIYDPDYFVGISNVLIVLYQKFPSVGWLGYLLVALLSLSYLMMLSLLLEIRNKFILYSVIVFLSCFVQYSFFRLNFTQISTIGVFSGFFFIVFYEKLSLNFLGCLVFIIGLLIRPNIQLVLAFQFLLFIFLTLIYQNDRKLQIRKAVFIVSSILILVCLWTLLYNEDAINFNVDGRIEWLVQDGYFLTGIEAEELSRKSKLILEAIATWNTQDSEVINRSAIYEIVSQHAHSFNLLKFIRNKIEMSISFTQRYSNEKVSFNFSYKYFLLVLLLLTLTIISVLQIVKRQFSIYFRSTVLTVFMLLILFLLFAKVEERFTLTYLIGAIFYFILLISINKVRTGFAGLPLCMLFLALSILYTNQTIEQSRLLNENLAYSEKTTQYINNNFKGKIILLDAYTPYLFLGSPFKNVDLDPSIRLSMGLNYMRRYFLSIESALSKSCNMKPSYIQSYQCAEAMSEQVVFFYWDKNIDFLKRWNLAFYGINNEFSVVGKTAPLIRNPYLWANLHYGFYKFANSAKE